MSIAGFLFLAAGVIAGVKLVQTRQGLNEFAAGTTKIAITPAASDVNRGENITLAVKMDTGANQITGIDLLIKFDPAAIQISSIQRGADVAALNNTITSNFNNTSGSISYAIFTLNKNQALSGSSAEVLKINARVVNNAPFWTSAVSFDSSSAVSAVGETQNAITDKLPASITVVSGIVSPTDTPTPTLVPTPTVTPAPGTPNYCGGTCGSNSNCQANYICYQGFCRNPSCPSDVTCGCSTTAPTPTATTTRASTVKTKTPSPAPEIVYYTGNFPSSTLPPTIKPVLSPLPTLVAVAGDNNSTSTLDFKYIAITIIGAIVFIAAVIVLVRTITSKNKVPEVYMDETASAFKRQQPKWPIKEENDTPFPPVP